MGKEEPEAAAHLKAQMQLEGIDFLDHCQLQEVTYSKDLGFEIHYGKAAPGGSAATLKGILKVDAVLVAAGKHKAEHITQHITYNITQHITCNITGKKHHWRIDFSRSQSSQQYALFTA